MATLTEPTTYRYQLAFTEEALDVFGDQSRALSLSLPMGTTPARDTQTDAKPVSAFLEGLLPEGNLRSQVASTLGVLTIDKIALLSQVGAECAGAVQFLADDVLPTSGHVRPLTATEVNHLVSDLPTYHFPEGTEPQASLAGLQDKVLLTRTQDGGWGWPEGGAPSSHIVKPEPTAGATLPNLIQTEDWALAVARRAGLSAAVSEVDTFDGRRAIVVTRYDRAADGRRIHQEDFCQALGLEPGAKYESSTEYERQGSRLSRLVALAAPRSEDPTAFRLDLLRAVTFNVVIGNGDAHSKNYSILLDRVGRVALAPLYDTAPVMHIDAKYKGTGHVIAGSTRIDWVRVETLVSEARSWGLSQRLAHGAVVDTMERVSAAVDAVEAPTGVAEARENLQRFWEHRAWPRSWRSDRQDAANDGRDEEEKSVSASQYRSQLERKRKQRGEAEKKAGDYRSKESARRTEANKARQAAGKTKSDSTRKSKMREAERKEREAETAGKDAARWQGKATNYSREERLLQTKADDAEVKEANAADRRRQSELERAYRRAAADRSQLEARMSRTESLAERALTQLSNPKAEKLRILILGSSAQGDLRVGREQKRIRAAVEAALLRDQIELDVRPAATTADLLDGITRFRPHVVHFSGHADDELVVFEDEQDEFHDGAIVTAGAFASVMRATDEPPLLVLLNACNTASQASQLVGDMVPFAIGMADEVQDGDAINYAAQFYAAIANGQSISSAHLAGRARLELDGLDGAELPTLAWASEVDPRAAVLVKPLGSL